MIQESEIQKILQENNVALREAIAVLYELDHQIQESRQELPRKYPGYTTPPKYGFMQ